MTTRTTRARNNIENSNASNSSLTAGSKYSALAAIKVRKWQITPVSFGQIKVQRWMPETDELTSPVTNFDLRKCSKL
jgi:hypothetical protein